MSVSVGSVPIRASVLACAKAADADYIVTGDPHLLRLGSYEGIPVVTAAQLLERFAVERG